MSNRKSKAQRFREFISRYSELLGANWQYLDKEQRAHLWAAWHDGFEQASLVKKAARRQK